jgi:hypothetical protein
VPAKRKQEKEIQASLMCLANIWVVVHFKVKMKSEHLESCHVEERDISSLGFLSAD